MIHQQREWREGIHIASPNEVIIVGVGDPPRRPPLGHREGITQVELEYIYHHTGVMVDGHCEMRQGWYTSQSQSRALDAGFRYARTITAVALSALANPRGTRARWAR